MSQAARRQDAPDPVRPATLVDLSPDRAQFRAAVLAGLAADPKTLPCKFFYDEAGAALFEQICELPEYYPTRTEFALLRDHAAAIGRLVGPGARIVEFGSGAGVKIRLLLEGLEAPAGYVPIDISRAHLQAAAADIARARPDLPVAPICADYTQAIVLPELPGLSTLGFFPGSTIGNFDPDEAAHFLARARRMLGDGSRFLIGIDLVKPRARLEAAYDDAAGVTARFNKNLLLRINRELGGSFDPDAFAHRALWNEGSGRVEMHLQSLAAQTALVDGVPIAFAAGETIHTENSYKYTLDGFAALAERGGFRAHAHWTDEDALFAIVLLDAA